LAAFAGSESCCLCSATTRGAALGAGFAAADRAVVFTVLALLFTALRAFRDLSTALLRALRFASARGLARCSFAANFAFTAFDFEAAFFTFGFCFDFAVALAMYKVPGR
jgi:hypothetical protein